MKRFLFLMVMLTVLVPDIHTQPVYPYDSIPTHLRARAKAVVRSGQRIITLISDKQSRLETKMVITLLNDQASDLLMVGIPYDDLRRVSSIRARAYDASGKLIWILKKYQILDARDFSGPEKLSDARKKVFEIPAYNYPFTIEYSYVMALQDLFLSPAAYLQQDPEISVEESGIQYIIPDGSGFNYKTLHLKSPADSMHRNNKLYLSWKEENLPAGRSRKYAAPLVNQLPVVYGTPLNFSLSGYKGNFNSWQDYGRWMGQLIAGRDVLDPEHSEKALTLVQNVPERRGKIRALYEYMQRTTHYFFIGFGVGGNQPIPASEVAESGYGDCKALSNYMKALLKAVGIESYYTLVKSGERKSMLADFPCNQFDHVILCVPDERDTIWLECTDPNSPFNYLGSFTCDRHVLALTPDGGHIFKTPAYGSNVNRSFTFSNITLKENGDATVMLEIKRCGLLHDELYKISESKSDDRKAWIADQTGITAFDIEKEEYEFNRQEEIPAAVARFELRIRDLAARSNQMLVVTPSFVSDLTFIDEDPYEVELSKAFQQNDSVQINIPPGLSISYLPEEKRINSRFGSYSSEISIRDQCIFFKRQMNFNKGNYPKEAYPEFYRFITDMVTADKEVVVLTATAAAE